MQMKGSIPICSGTRKSAAKGTPWMPGLGAKETLCKSVIN